MRPNRDNETIEEMRTRLLAVIVKYPYGANLADRVEQEKPIPMSLYEDDISPFAHWDE